MVLCVSHANGIAAVWKSGFVRSDQTPLQHKRQLSPKCTRSILKVILGAHPRAINSSIKDFTSAEGASEDFCWPLAKLARKIMICGSFSH